MTYLVINPDGSLDRHDETPTADRIRQTLAGGLAPVRVDPMHELAGWVVDDGHPKQLPRNPVGAVMLMALGAGVQPYCGPVVITGWCSRHELQDLEFNQIRGLYVMHSDVRAAIDGTTQTPTAQTDAIRQAAAQVNSQARPVLTVVASGQIRRPV